MKIFYDHQAFSLQKYGGVSRYFNELISYLKKNKSIIIENPIRCSNNIYLKKRLNNKSILKNNLENIIQNLHTSNNGITNFLYRLNLKYIYYTNKNLNIKYLKKNDFDIFHPTYYDTYFLNYIKNKPFVLTVHDMIHEIYCNKYPIYNDKTIFRKKKLIEKAASIIAVSNNTKEDILKFYKIDEAKIKVIHHCNYLNAVKPNKSITIPDKYLLYVGNRDYYKNFIFFLESIASLLNDNKGLYLICAGGGEFNSIEIEKIKELNIENNIKYQNIDDGILAYLYKNAIAFIYPSVYEGFGLPILESFQFGCPVVLSNTSSFPEVAGDAGLFFDPLDKDSIKRTIKEIITNKNLRKKLAEKSKKQLKNFSFKKMISETKAVYESVR